MLKLYQAPWCPYCIRVRQKLSELGVPYENIDVPDHKPERAELMGVSGQNGVPTLVTEDGRVIADDDEAIIAYLEKHHSEK